MVAAVEVCNLLQQLRHGFPVVCLVYSHRSSRVLHLIFKAFRKCSKHESTKLKVNRNEPKENFENAELNNGLADV